MQMINTRLGYLHKVPKFFAEPDELNADKVSQFVSEHKLNFRPRYQLLADYYKGEHAILSRQMEANKPNNKNVNNYAEYITNVKTGYFMGKPVTYKLKGKLLMDGLTDWLDANDEQDNNTELAKLMSIHGHAFELHYINAEGRPKFKHLSPLNAFMIYSDDIEETPIAGVRYVVRKVGEKELVKAELYLKDKVVYFKGESAEELVQIEEKAHPYGDVPMIEFLNNEERLGDFENVISLIDAYELVQSDTTNEVQYFADSYLKIRNLLMTDDTDIADMKNNRIIMLDEDGEADWLTKNINDTHIQNLLEVIKNDIHKFSKTPSLTDEKFSSNLSGVAIRFKLHTMEQDTVNKERKFKKALMKRFRLLTNILGMLEGVKFDISELKINFVRNIPNNILELAQIVAQLNGMVSLETLLALLPFVDNVQEELDRMKKEQAVESGMFKGESDGGSEEDPEDDPENGQDDPESKKQAKAG